MTWVLVFVWMAGSASAQVTGPLVPALTPEQIQGESGAGAEVRPVGRDGAGAASDLQGSAPRRDRAEVLRRLRQLPDHRRADDARVGLRLPANAGRPYIRRANQPCDRRELFILQPGGRAARVRAPERTESAGRDLEISDRQEPRGFGWRTVRACSRRRARRGFSSRRQTLVEPAAAESPAHAPTRSSTRAFMAPKTTAPSRPTFACRASCRPRRRSPPSEH